MIFKATATKNNAFHQKSCRFLEKTVVLTDIKLH